MTDIQKKKRIDRQRRQRRVRAKISGTAQRPRITVFKSNAAVYVQAVDDVAKTTLAAVRDLDLKKRGSKLPEEAAKLGAKAQHAFTAGLSLGKLLADKGVKIAVFDKGGFKYHGRVKAVADGLRAAGITI